MEKALYLHLRDSKHRHSEMVAVTERKLWDEDSKAQREGKSIRQLDALAFYTAAVCLKEQEHIPLIGPSVDRRMLALLTHLCNSDTVQALVCASCAQVHVSVKSWTQSWTRDLWQTWKQAQGRSGIQYYKVGATILQMLKENPDAFRSSFDLKEFMQRFASDAHVDGNPFQSCSDLEGKNYEWKRNLHYGSERIEILCCPEDFRSSSQCRHNAEDLCAHCEIPLCMTCFLCCLPRTSAVIPMGLGNDNFWGYTTELLYRYQVRWIEACPACVHAAATCASAAARQSNLHYACKHLQQQL